MTTLQPRARHASKSAADRATVAAGFVTGLVSGALAHGLSAEALLRAAGISPGVLRDARLRVPLGAYVALYNEVVRALDDEGLGLFRLPIRRGAFEFLCRGTVGAAHLGDAFERASRFLDVVLPDLRVELVREGAVARLRIEERLRIGERPGDPRRVFAFEWLLRLLHGVACWLAARPIALLEVRFPFPAPAHAADYALIYTERSTFGAGPLEATLDARAMQLPVRRSESDVAAFLEGAPGKISVLYRRDREAARALREYLAGSLAAAPSLEAAASALGLSSRTLHRRLRDEGTSFREVKDALRRDAALARLRSTRESVAAIAADLGYAEPSAFFRAFQAWTGEAPTAYRKRVANG